MGKDLSLRSVLSNSSLPPSESRILLAHVLEKHYQLPRSALLSRDAMELNAPALAEWEQLESKRLAGEPIAYLVGKRGFHNIELYVAPGVLIPRPETELLVEMGLQEMGRLAKPTHILDLGTGSGAIALAIAHSSANAIVTATDQSSDALEIAKKNAALLKLESRVQFFQGSWYEALTSETLFDIILSNPPYIANHDPHLQQGDLRFEPASALTDHANGLSCLQAIISEAKQHLKAGGLLAVEHGYDQAHIVEEMLLAENMRDIQNHLDLSGCKRVLSCRNN
jgi:release factor glutamine methyltransferase